MAATSDAKRSVGPDVATVKECIKKVQAVPTVSGSQQMLKEEIVAALEALAAG